MSPSDSHNETLVEQRLACDARPFDGAGYHKIASPFVKQLIERFSLPLRDAKIDEWSILLAIGFHCRRQIIRSHSGDSTHADRPREPPMAPLHLRDAALDIHEAVVDRPLEEPPVLGERDRASLAGE